MVSANSAICILGGGFGGLYTALALAQQSWQGVTRPAIHLIDRSDRFVFLPLLYELITGELQAWEVAPRYRDLLANTPIQFHRGVVSEVDLQQQRVVLESGQVFEFGQLVLALGGETPRDLAPGAETYALPFRSLEDAIALNAQLSELERQPDRQVRIAVVGAGPSGVELACKLADRLGDRAWIRLIELGEDILRNSPEFNREAAERALQQRQILLDLKTGVAAVEADAIVLQRGDQTERLSNIDLVLWTVGNRVPAAVAALDLPKNARGQLQTQLTLQINGYDNLFALGDLAELPTVDGKAIPATAQAAFQQASCLAANLVAQRRDQPLADFQYQALGEMLALGSGNATLTGLGLTLEGPLAAVARRLAYLYRMPTPTQQCRVGLNWLLQPFDSLLHS
ncbi:NAD(P)/FAD-dependent oxidoreductase [Synechococcus elongatus IITB4]|uniref:NAD(P)/FAD-dependent oxidoreductase n=1 Tax=Synechococcus elongatus TaxID=32046 RepID=UPI0030D20592